MMDALLLLLAPQSLVVLIAGTLMVMLTSFIPGVSSVGLASLALAVTASWSVEHALVLFGAVTGGATFMGSVTAILFNVPGSASSSVALLDGYPIAASGRPQMALSVAALSSALGSLIGVAFMMLSLPWLSSVITRVGAFELAVLVSLGLWLVLLLPSSSLLASWTAILAGLLAAAVGADLMTGAPRLNFGIPSLYEGFAILPIMLGVFTLPEVSKWARSVAFSHGTSIEKDPRDSIGLGVSAVMGQLPLVFKSALIGTSIGAIPGLGGPVAGYTAYGLAAKNPNVDPPFGKGQLQGLVAPESAIDAKDGGMLIPTLSLGIPGSESCVILLAALAVHGLQPGADMLTRHLNLTYLLVFALVSSNLLTSSLGMALAPILARLRHVSLHRMVPWVLLLVVVSVSAYTGSMLGVYQLLGFFVFGLLCRSAQIPVMPFVVAFILGDVLERNSLISLQLAQWGRIDPIKFVYLLALVVVVSMIACLHRLRHPQWKSGNQPIKQYMQAPNSLAQMAIALALLLVGALGIFQLLVTVDGGTPYFALLAICALLHGLWWVVRLWRSAGFSGAQIGFGMGSKFHKLAYIAGAPVVGALVVSIVLQPTVGLHGCLGALAGVWYLWQSFSGPVVQRGARLFFKAGFVSLFTSFLFGQTFLPLYPATLNDGTLWSWIF